MTSYNRYAVYYLPDEPELSAFGASWLGWDVETGNPVDHLPIPGIEAFTDTPRKYGFHGTLKPPFRLAEGCSFEELFSAVQGLAASRPSVSVDAMQIASLGKFLAIIPKGEQASLAELAFSCVRELDMFRAPPSPSELERRRAKGLTKAQDALLMQWGYPYVDTEFRFHLTLSGSLSPEDLDRAHAAASRQLPDLSKPFDFKSISLVGELPDGRFELIRRFPLLGQPE